MLPGVRGRGRRLGRTSGQRDAAGKARGRVWVGGWVESWLASSLAGPAGWLLLYMCCGVTGGPGLVDWAVGGSNREVGDDKTDTGL